MDDIVSVIIPAYNAEKYIIRCIDSVRNQTYDKLEIIIINDGSTDNTLHILRKVEKEDKRIIIYNKENEGVSRARNIGLSIAKGRYVYFIDSDDYLDKTAIEKLYVAINDNNADMSICGFNVVYENEIKKVSFIRKRNVCVIDEYLIEMSKKLYSVYYGALWNKLYDASIIREHAIRFKEDVSYGEDMLFNIDCLKHTYKVGIIDECLYSYYQENECSLTKNRDAWELWKFAKERINKCMVFYEDMGMMQECSDDINTYIASEVIGPTYYIIKNKSKEEAVTVMRKIYDDTVIKKAVKHTKSPTMVHRAARLCLKSGNYGLFYRLMKMWIFIQKY